MSFGYKVRMTQSTDDLPLTKLRHILGEHTKHLKALTCLTTATNISNRMLPLAEYGKPG